MEEDATNRQEMSTVLRESTTREQLAQMSQALVKLQRIHQNLHETIEELQKQNSELHSEVSNKFDCIKKLDLLNDTLIGRLDKYNTKICHLQQQLFKIPVWVRMFCGVDIQLDKE